MYNIAGTVTGADGGPTDTELGVVVGWRVCIGRKVAGKVRRQRGLGSKLCRLVVAEGNLHGSLGKLLRQPRSLPQPCVVLKLAWLIYSIGL